MIISTNIVYRPLIFLKYFFYCMFFVSGCQVAGVLFKELNGNLFVFLNFFWVQGFQGEEDLLEELNGD